MKETTSTIMRDITIKHEEPETTEEIDTMAEAEGTAAELATRYYKHHVWMATLRSTLASKLEEVTGQKRKTKEKDGKQVIAETDTTFYERLSQEGHLEGVDVNALAQEIVDANPMDFKKKIREGGGGKEVAQKWIEVAKQLEADGRLDAFVKKHGLVLGDDPEENYRIVGNKIRLIKTEAERRAREQALADL